MVIFDSALDKLSVCAHTLWGEARTSLACDLHSSVTVCECIWWHCLERGSSSHDCLTLGDWRLSPLRSTEHGAGYLCNPSLSNPFLSSASSYPPPFHVVGDPLLLSPYACAACPLLSFISRSSVSGQLLLCWTHTDTYTSSSNVMVYRVCVWCWRHIRQPLQTFRKAESQEYFSWKVENLQTSQSRNQTGSLTCFVVEHRMLEMSLHSCWELFIQH